MVRGATIVSDKVALAARDVISALFPESDPGNREQQSYRPPAAVVDAPEQTTESAR
jgi:hypothetical protein